MARPWRRPWRCLPPLCFSVPFSRVFFTVSHTLFWFSLIIRQLIRRDRLALNYWDSLFTTLIFVLNECSDSSVSAPRYSAAEVNGRKVQVKKNFTLETRSWTEWCRGRALGWWWRLAGCLSTLPLQAAAALALQWRTQNASAADQTRAKIQRHFSLLKLLK